MTELITAPEGENIQKVTIDGKEWGVVKVHCCREWIILASANRTGKCGYCGQVPQ